MDLSKEVEPHEFFIKPRKEGGSSAVSFDVSGRVDGTNASEFLNFFMSLIERGCVAFIIDLTRTKNIDLDGWNKIVTIWQMCRDHKGALQIVVDPDSKAAIELDILGLEKFLEVTFVSASLRMVK